MSHQSTLKLRISRASCFASGMTGPPQRQRQQQKKQKEQEQAQESHQWRRQVCQHSNPRGLTTSSGLRALQLVAQHLGWQVMVQRDMCLRYFFPNIILLKAEALVLACIPLDQHYHSCSLCWINSRSALFFTALLISQLLLCWLGLKPRSKVVETAYSWV